MTGRRLANRAFVTVYLSFGDRYGDDKSFLVGRTNLHQISPTILPKEGETITRLATNFVLPDH